MTSFVDKYDELHVKAFGKWKTQWKTPQQTGTKSHIPTAPGKGRADIDVLPLIHRDGEVFPGVQGR